jgi:hypothetical protein
MVVAPGGMTATWLNAGLAKSPSGRISSISFMTATLFTNPDSHAARRSPPHRRCRAAYLAKYLTKTTQDFGLPARVRHPRAARQSGANPHASESMTPRTPSLWMVARSTTGCGTGWPPSATAGVQSQEPPLPSTTFGALRRARTAWRRRPARLDPDAEIRDLLDDTDDAGTAECS